MFYKCTSYIHPQSFSSYINPQSFSILSLVCVYMCVCVYAFLCVCVCIGVNTGEVTFKVCVFR